MTGYLRVKHEKYYMICPFKDAQGKWRQKSKCTGLPQKGHKREAEKMLQQWQAELSAQALPSLTSGNILFLDFMRDWLKDIAAHSVKENTLEKYYVVFNRHIELYQPFWNLPLKKLTPAIIQSYYNDMVNTLSPNTIRKHHANIHSCLEYAVRLDLLPYNPAKRIVLPKKEKYQGAKVFVPDQLIELLDIFKDDPLEAVIQLTTTYGLRRSEVCGLQWSSIDFDAKTLLICHTAVKSGGKLIYSDSTKTATSRRRLPLTSSMVVYLQQLKKRQEEHKRLLGSLYTSSGYVCTKVDGSPIDPDFVTHHFQSTLKKRGLSYRFHDLRHSTVYALRKGGCDPKDIQTWLGHSDVSTTLNIYGHMMDGDMSHIGDIMDAALSTSQQATA